MTVERGVRLMAGVMVLLSLALAHFFSLYWLWLTVFVGTQPVAVGIHKLVPGHDHAAHHGPEGVTTSGGCRNACSVFSAGPSSTRVSGSVSGLRSLISVKRKIAPLSELMAISRGIRSAYETFAFRPRMEDKSSLPDIESFSSQSHNEILPGAHRRPSPTGSKPNPLE